MSECVRRVKGERKKRREEIKQEQEEEETGTDRKTDEGIMRRQAGSEKNRAEERQERGGEGARAVGEGPGGKAKEEQRPKDLSAALPGQQSQLQEALPWQAASSAHMQRP